MYKILIPDKIHIHERGFKSIIDLHNDKKIELVYLNKYDEIKSLYGNYEKIKSMFLEEYDYLKSKKKDELFNENIAGINLFSLIKAEMLSFLMPQNNWYENSISCENEFIFDKAYNENFEILLLNMAVGIFWFNFWKKELKNYSKFNFCIIFSGSLIYSKILSFLLQNTPLKVFVVEHFFTGNDFYFEEKYTHIANNSDIKYKNYYDYLEKIFLENDSLEQKKDITKSINKLLLSNNKNVKQPESSIIDFNFNGEKIILILGQVINDFSILETDLENINSLDIYKNLIFKIIKGSNYNIIFKAHPWEKMKINIKSSLTKDNLTKFIFDNLTEEERNRIRIVEDFNINTLFDISDVIVGLCSQSLLEASFYGKKTHQIGKAFFSNKGFTYDYRNETHFVESLILNDTDSFLNIDEYEKLIKFFTIIFEYHLVSVHNSGKSKILKKFSQEIGINLVTKTETNHLVPSNKIEVKNNGDKTELSNKLNILEAITYDESFSPSLKRKIITGLIKKFSSEKKYNKFKQNPQKFFLESKYLIVKLIGNIY